eukprot:6854408-Lingulodinium_polyedra.AAC.1
MAQKATSQQAGDPIETPKGQRKGTTSKGSGGVRLERTKVCSQFSRELDTERRKLAKLFREARAEELGVSGCDTMPEFRH